MNVNVRGTANSISAQIGSRISHRRELLGISQQSLADRLGVSKAELVRYENGDVDVHPQQLLILSSALEVTVDHFFGNERDAPGFVPGESEGSQSARADTWRMLEAFESIEDPEMRSSLLNLAEKVNTAGRD